MFTVIITLDNTSDFDRFDRMVDWCDERFKDFTQITYDCKWLDYSRRKSGEYQNCVPWEFSFSKEEDRTLFQLTWCYE